jgi:hypothetical protein
VTWVVLLTWHGTLLCVPHRGEIGQCRFADADATPLPVNLPFEQNFYARFLGGNQAVDLEITEGPLANFVAHTRTADGTLAFCRNGRYLAAGPDMRVEHDRTEVRDWETFFPISLADLAHLRTIHANDWLLDRSHCLIRRDSIMITPGHRLCFGSWQVALRHLLPLDGGTLPHSFSVDPDGWQLERAHRYRPLVYFAAFGKPAFLALLKVAIESLIGFGNYDGAILVLTDTPPTRLHALLPGLDAARLVVLPMKPTDRVGFLAARYAILDWPDAASFQPILYCDTDIVFDLPIAPLLQAIATSRRICAPAEDFSLLARDPSVGAELMAADGAQPRYAIGFNSGTLGIPNLTEHGDALRLTRTILVNRADLLGRRRPGFIDQPIANYVSFRSGHFDTQVLTRFVRYGWPDISRDTAGRCGLVHFFYPPGNAQAKYQAMEQYRTALTAVDPDGG